MSSIMPDLAEKAAQGEAPEEFKDNLILTYRHWFVVALLVFSNVVIFGCIFLVVFNKIHWGF